MVDLSAYETAIRNARSELEDCTQRKQELESRIVRLRQAIDGLTALCETASVEKSLASSVTDLAAGRFPPAMWSSAFGSIPPTAGSLADFANLGLSTSCQEALKAGARFMTPVEVKEQLEMMRVDLSPYNNVLASIHGVLKRLRESGRALAEEVDGKTAYKWNPNFVGPRRRRPIRRAGR